jgi:polysaccharide biosynthesis transport protein
MTSLSVFDPAPQAGTSGEDPRGGGAGGGAAPGSPAQPNPLLIIHRGLRGRYPYAIALGLVLGVIFAFLGYTLVKPIYQSVALLRVAPTQAKILFQTEDNSQMADWDSFVAAQATLLQSRRVITFALGNERLATAGWDRSGAGEQSLADGLDVRRSRGDQIISVVFKHTDPAKAQAAVNAIVDSYDELKDESFGLEAGNQERALTDYIRERRSRLESLRLEEAQIVTRSGAADIEIEHRSKSELLAQQDRMRMELQQRLALAKPAAPVDPDAAPAEPAKPNDDELARADAEFADLLATRRAIEAAIRDNANLTPQHRVMVDLNERLAKLDAKLDLLREQLLAEPAAELRPKDLVAGEMNAEEIKERLALLETGYQALSSQVRDIGTARQQLQTVRETKEDVKKELDLATERLTALEVERNNTKTGRISILQRGDAPLAPTTDRRIPLAGAGFVGGMGLGVGLIWLLGFARGGYRFADEIDDSTLSVPLLEVLPHVDDSSPEWLDLAAHSVHHVRGVLNNARRSDDAPLTILVSSGTAGEGKSYVANALAHSFAISDHKTVLVDIDLLGCQLSYRLGMSERLGLRDAAAEGTLPEAFPIGDHLSIVPVGLRDDFQPEQLNRPYLLKLIESLRTQFDTIIIDSGPILGSLEASLLTQIADRTLLVVARGQRPGIVKAAVARVRQLGGTVAGFVFNRAVRGDYLSSSYSASVSRHSLSDRTSRPRPRPANAPISPLLLSMRSSLSGSPASGPAQPAPEKPNAS